MLASAFSAKPAAAQCKWCVTPTDCGDVNENARSSCTEHAGGLCENGSEDCIIQTAQVAEALRLESSDFLRTAAPAGMAALAPVGGNRFAEWRCDGELLHLVERGSDGMIHVLPVEKYADRYRFAAVLARSTNGITG